MALVDSGRAIGAVTRLLSDHLMRHGFAVAIGKPEQAALNDTLSRKLNLFLYETNFDGSLRNVALHPEQPPPLWLTLRYLVTAFDASEESDTADAHDLLGQGLSALQELNFLQLDNLVPADVRRALENCPEPLKITFEDSPPDLLSKIMQGTDEKYRLSVAFQVRPVMIVPSEPPRFSLLVGVDYTRAPPATIGEDGVGLAVLASLGSRLTSVEPPAFEPAAEFTLHGEDLHLSNLDCLLGNVALSIVGQRPDTVTVRAEGAVPSGAPEGPIAAGNVISAGEHALLLRQLMPNGRYRSSNILSGRLLPVVSGVAVAAGNLTVNGLLLGTWDDDVLVAMVRDDAVARLFEPSAPPPAPAEDRTVVPGADQKSLTIGAFAAGLDAGQYRVMVRVNGQQARLSPTVTVS